MGAKAFMSYVGNGPRPGVYSGREGAGDALAEAQRILAETEPRVPCRDVFNVGRTSNTEHSNIGPLAMCHAPYAALAERLAWFLALELDSPAPASTPGGGELGRIGKCWARGGETAARAGAAL